MASLVAIIIADIVPADQVATFRGYVNISQIVGRSCGGVVGGWLTQAVGWRWYVHSCLQKDPVVTNVSRAKHHNLGPSSSKYHLQSSL